MGIRVANLFLATSDSVKMEYLDSISSRHFIRHCFPILIIGSMNHVSYGHFFTLNW